MLNIAVKGIAEIITLPGYINVDFADVKTVMTKGGVAIMGAATASGEGRAIRAISEALESPLLNNSDILGARDILLNITSGAEEVTTDEMTEITSHILRKVGNNAAVIWGVGTDMNLGDALSVTIIATGFPETEIDLMCGDARRRKNEEKIILREADVRLHPNLTPAEIRELEDFPAYERRDLLIN